MASQMLYLFLHSYVHSWCSPSNFISQSRSVEEKHVRTLEKTKILGFIFIYNHKECSRKIFWPRTCWFSNEFFYMRNYYRCVLPNYCNQRTQLLQIFAAWSFNKNHVWPSDAQEPSVKPHLPLSLIDLNMASNLLRKHHQQSLHQRPTDSNSCRRSLEDPSNQQHLALFYKYFSLILNEKKKIKTAALCSASIRNSLRFVRTLKVHAQIRVFSANFFSLSYRCKERTFWDT